ncbi:hypothetical protein AGMMS4952_00790 [Spirochaetia bacterium]|nr:hypothetical protein AGMMS4952_00790 [Spirochaetia bacterium]
MGRANSGDGYRGGEQRTRQGNQDAQDQQAGKRNESRAQILKTGPEPSAAAGLEQVQDKGQGGEIVGKNTAKFLAQGESDRSGSGGRRFPSVKEKEPIEDEGLNKRCYGIILCPFDMPAMLGYISMKVKYFTPWGAYQGQE